MPRRLPLDPKQADSDELVRTTVELRARHHFRISRWCRENDIGIADALDALMQAAMKNESVLKESIEAVRQRKVLERATRRALANFGGLTPDDLALIQTILVAKGRDKPRRRAKAPSPKVAAS
jgi:hypothetical protein